MSLFFTGLKHSGKTTAAKRVARALDMEWKDSDDLMLDHLEGRSVREFYRSEGKEAFMALETSVVRMYLDAHPDVVMSLGGGAADNMELMKTIGERGKVIYLSRPEKTLLAKVLEKSGVPAFLDRDDVEGSWHRVYIRRDRIYTDSADIRIELGDYRDKEETMESILSCLRERGIV